MQGTRPKEYELLFFNDVLASVSCVAALSCFIQNIPPLSLDGEGGLARDNCA